MPDEIICSVNGNCSMRFTDPMDYKEHQVECHADEIPQWKMTFLEDQIMRASERQAERIGNGDD